MVRTKKKEKQEKRRAHYTKKKNRRKFIQKVLEALKKSQEAKCGRGRSLFFKRNFFLGKT